MRLNRFLATAGVASRRKCETIIDAGRVSVNGLTAEGPAVIVDPARDVVALDGRVVRLAPMRRHLVLNKPMGVLSTVSDPRGRPTVMDLVPSGPDRLYPAGRLDADTTGLVLLTNDGRLAHRVMHPRHNLPKRYLALVSGVASPASLLRLVEGVELDDGSACALEAALVATDGRRSAVRVVLGEGRKRQVRRMLGAIGHRVEALHRYAIGPVVLVGLAEGAHRELTPFELRSLRCVLALGDA